MFNSKALKPVKMRWQYEDEEKSFFGNVVYFFQKYMVWPVKDFVWRIKERSKRSYDYARFGWENFDWDMSCAWDLFGFKLKRLYKALEKGHAIQEPEDLAALKELTKIVYRLSRSDNYSRKYHRGHDKKWGRIETRTEPWIDEKGVNRGSTWISWRKNCPENADEELKKRERNDFMCCIENGEKDRIKDVNRMAEIIIKHGLRFWD